MGCAARLLRNGKTRRTRLLCGGVRCVGCARERERERECRWESLGGLWTWTLKRAPPLEKQRRRYLTIVDAGSSGREPGAVASLLSYHSLSLHVADGPPHRRLPRARLPMAHDGDGSRGGPDAQQSQGEAGPLFVCGQPRRRDKRRVSLSLSLVSGSREERRARRGPHDPR